MGIFFGKEKLGPILAEVEREPFRGDNVGVTLLPLRVTCVISSSAIKGMTVQGVDEGEGGMMTFQTYLRNAGEVLNFEYFPDA